MVEPEQMTAVTQSKTFSFSSQLTGLSWNEKGLLFLDWRGLTFEHLNCMKDIRSVCVCVRACVRACVCVRARARIRGGI